MNEMKPTYLLVAGVFISVIFCMFLPMQTAIFAIGVLILLISLVIIVKGSKKESIENIENEPLPINLQLIEKEQIKSYFSNLEPLSEQDKKDLKDKSNKRILIAILCLIVLIAMSFISGSTTELKENLVLIGIVFGLFIIMSIIRLIKSGSMNKNYENCRKMKAYIYDKKAFGYNDYGPNYYARVWDNNKYVINEWIYLPSTLYNSKEVIVYYVEDNNNIKLYLDNKKGI